MFAEFRVLLYPHPFGYNEISPKFSSVTAQSFNLVRLNLGSSAVSGLENIGLRICGTIEKYTEKEYVVMKENRPFKEVT